jgi:hypothetical protein
MTISLLFLALAAVLVVVGSWATAWAMVRSDAFSDARQHISLTESADAGVSAR